MMRYYLALASIAVLSLTGCKKEENQPGCDCKGPVAQTLTNESAKVTFAGSGSQPYVRLDAGQTLLAMCDTAAIPQPLRIEGKPVRVTGQVKNICISPNVRYLTTTVLAEAQIQE